MARPLGTDSLSLTAAGVALVTSADGTIEPNAVEGLIIDDCRVLSRWQLSTFGVVLRRVGWQRTGPSSDRLLFSVGTANAADPIGMLERDRTVTGRGLTETIRLTAFAATWTCRLLLSASRDDQTVFQLGDNESAPLPEIELIAGDDGGQLPPPTRDAPPVEVVAPGWRGAGKHLVADIEVVPNQPWVCTVTVHALGHRGATAHADPGKIAVDTEPAALGQAVDSARNDLRALTMPIGDRDILAAGSPVFLALFGRDSLIAGMQFLVDSTRPLTDVLGELAHHQATRVDPASGAQPGRILHELRLGRAGVFGVPAGTPYYGAVDTSAMFVVALGEAMRWGAQRHDIASLVPAARAALQWCAKHGDVDGDGFIESVPHPTGLTNLGWKDSSDGILDSQGNTIIGKVALAEVQAYWYRALRSMADIERWLEIGDGTENEDAASRLAERFNQQFVYETEQGPYVGLALDDDKDLLTVRTSNAGHVLWSGILAAAIAHSVAEQLAGPDMFSGWGVRTVSAAAPGYNPFGYHRGSVWPHDTAFAIHGASRYGRHDVVRRLSDGLLALSAANDGQLPELLSGLGCSEVSLPVPYPAACRPQAWAAGAPLVVLRALLGLEPDVSNGVVRLHPCLDDYAEITVRNLRLGDHTLSFTARGSTILDLEAPTIHVLTGNHETLANSAWAHRR